MFQRIARAFGSAPVGSGPTRRVRLAVEPLEDRAVPAAFTAATVAELIQHINAANASPGADTIALTAGATYTLTAADNRTSGHNGLPVVAPGGLTVTGNGATVERSTAAGTADFRLFEVAAGAALTLQNLTLQGGRAVGYGPPAGGFSLPAAGGAILNQGTLSLTGVTLQNNTAQGITLRGFNTQFGGSAYGGAVYSDGSLTVTSTVIRNNAAVGGFGGDGYTYYGYPGFGGNDSPPSKQTVPGGNGGNGFGGGVYVAGGTAVFTSSTVTGNSALGGAGGKRGGRAGQGVGGGVYIAPAAGVALDDFTLTHVNRNTASTSAPDVYGSSTPL